MRRKTQRTIVLGATRDPDPRLQAFIEDLAQEDVAPATIKGYRADLLHFASWYEKHVGPRFAVKDLTTVDLKGYRAQMVNVDRLKGSTVNRRLHALKRLCR